MNKHWSTLLACLLLGGASAQADQAFRDHRYDGFKVLSANKEQIVFIGNSITNMHEWWEAFGNHNIVNRGTSGAVSDELLQNLESMISGKPKKAFIMIGTNDLGTNGINNAAHVAQNARLIVKQIKQTSPKTEIFIQSILPSGKRNLNLQKETNDSLKQICKDYNLEYVDLWDKLISVSQKDEHTLDRLHLSASGYRIWCNEIASKVGSNCVYPKDAVNEYNGLGGSHGMRVSAFAMQPVKAGDILMIGDEVIHGGEWHELLGSSKVKNRGTSWGWPGMNIADMTKEIPLILKKKQGDEEPAKIFICVGAADVNGSASLDNLKTAYQGLVNKVRELAPNAEIYLQSVLPIANADKNTSRTVPFNNMIKEIADAGAKITYVDTYTALSENNLPKQGYFSGNYLYGKGYAKLAQELAKHMGSDVKPLTEEQAAARYALLTARQNLTNTIVASRKIAFGTKPGQIENSKRADLYAAIETAEAELRKDESPSVDVLNKANETLSAKRLETLQHINQPAASVEGNEVWYKIYTPNRESRYLTSNGAGQAATGETDMNYARSMWKFVKRSDNTYNIINRADGTYLNPQAAFNSAISTQKEEPAKGWALSYSNSPSTYIITSGTVELNQTQSAHGYKIFNYSAGQNGQDRADLGCQFALTEAGTPSEEVIVQNKPVLTIQNIKLEGTPQEIPAADAAKVMASKTISVVIDFTSKALPKDPSYLVASTNAAGNKYFGVIMQENEKFGVRYIGDNNTEGYYTHGGINFGQRKRMVITMNEATKDYKYYIDGKFCRTVPGANLGAYGYKVFGNVTDVDKLYLGGIPSGETTKYGWSGDIHSIRFYNRVLTDTEIANLKYDNLDQEQASGEYTIDLANGKMSGSGTGSFKQIWKSNSTEPQLTLNAGHNNMMVSGNNIVAYVGQYSPETYTLSVPKGYVIESYSFDFCIHNNEPSIEVIAGGKTYASKAEDQTVTVTNINKMAATFQLKGANKGIVFKNFKVKVAVDATPAEPSTDIFVTAADAKIPYRIPAITKAKNGDLIAVADYRHSGADIGLAHNGRIDLHARISKDNGKTWGTMFPIIEGLGGNYASAGKSEFYVAFGDPCIVADRESNRVMVLSCAGNVSFPAGTRERHQGIAIFHSDNNGQTWSEPVDVAESIYSQFDNCSRGPVKAMFVGSGKIHQSRYVKVKDYYRLYAAVLVRDKNATHCNYVIYSDDFGKSWTVLGDPNIAPIPSGGDEPKAEELPDGSIVISSRCGGGRYYNIYSFSDSKKAEGSWGVMEFSGAGNNGVTAQNNSCNGEIMILPVVRKEDQKKMFLALQSVPLGPNRTNVGIYYKELATLEDFSSPKSFAKDWDGRHQASFIGSAYSTMTLQKDNTIGFLFEESTYGKDYTIVYKNYTIEKITGNKYSYDAEANANEVVNAGFDTKVDYLKSCVGKNVGNIKESSLETIETAAQAYKENPSLSAYESFNKAVQGVEYVGIEAGKYYRLRNSERNQGLYYLTWSNDKFSGAEIDKQDDGQLFCFMKDEKTGKFFVQNKKEGLYVAPSPKTSNVFTMVNQTSGAGVYVVNSTMEGLSSVECQNGTVGSYSSFHLDAGNKLVAWEPASKASRWFIEPTDLSTALDFVEMPSRFEQGNIYDLSGRLVTNPTKGIYIRNGRKFVKK